MFDRHDNISSDIARDFRRRSDKFWVTYLRSEKSKSFGIISDSPPPVELIMFAHLSRGDVRYLLFSIHEAMREDGN